MTFEYSLVAGVNDTKEDAEELGRLIHGHELSCESDTGQPDQGAGL